MAAVTLASVSSFSAYATVWGPGSLFNPLTGSSPLSIDFGDHTDTPVPEAESGEPGAVDVWVRIESASRSTLTVTWTGVSVGFELWAVPEEALADPEDATLLNAESGPTMVFPTGEDQVYLVRVHPMDESNNGASGTLSWSFAGRADGTVQLLADPIVYDDPSELRVSVLSASEGGDIEFEIDGDLVLTETADDTGILVGLTVPAEGLATGSHTLLVRDVTTGQEDTAGFDVVSQTVEPDADPPPATPTTPATGEVIRWVFELPDPDGMTYTFPNNPSEMSAPHAARVLNPDHTVNPAGQPIVFEGEPTPVDWTASGFCFDQDHYEALETWLALNRRFFAIDHLERAWVVTLENIEWTVVRASEYPWAHRYRLKFFIYDGPVALP